MKKLIFLIFMGLSVSLIAQNREIQFEQSKDWKKIVKKAKKEKKLIFIDCYTSWCGPCKMLAEQVFTKDDVADYFNKNFVNAKFDMEKDDDGVMLKGMYPVKAYPTLLFVDPSNEELVHILVGAGQAEWLIKGGQTANDPENNLKGLTKRYEQGETGPEFLKKYLDVLASAYMAEEQGKVASDYLNTLTVDQLATKENWEMIVKNINDPLSKSLMEVMANRPKFYELVGKEFVDAKLESSIKNSTLVLSHWKAGNDNFNQEEFDRMVNYLQNIDFYYAPTALAYLYTSQKIREKDFIGMLNSMEDAYKYNIFRGNDGVGYFYSNIEALTLCKDRSIVERGIKWIDQKCNETSDYFTKANLMNSKARLQNSIGDTLGAEKSKLDEEKYNKEGVDKSGGRMHRAIRMN